MDFFSNLKVGTRLILGFLVVALIGGFIGLQGILKTGEINVMATEMYDSHTMGLRHADEANVQLVAVGRALRSAILAADQQEREKHIANTQQRIKNVHTELDKAAELFQKPEGKNLVKKTLEAVAAYEKGVGEAITLIRAEGLMDSRQSTDFVTGALRAKADLVDDLLTELVDHKMGNAKSLKDEIDSIYQHNLWLLSLSTLGGLVVGIAIGVLLTRSLTAQLGGEPAEVASLAGKIAEGDLTAHIDTRNAKAGSVVAAMDTMQKALIRLVGGVRQASDNIVTGSNQIAMGNQDLSQRTEEQASNLEETAASMEEIGSTVKANAETAKQATQVVSAATKAAMQGGQVVRDVVATMGEISTSSNKINDIIGVIDSIAFQTNILALNAAVEAARAGEQGRGFAVVASEVRNLAQRSAEAAKEIKTLISTSVEKVEAGNQQVARAGETIDGVVAQVKRVADLMQEINAASQEQDAGIEQIGQAVQQLDTVTQQNASLVEEAAAAADSLSQQAKHLLEQVAVFRVPGGATDVTFARTATSNRIPKAQTINKPAAVRKPASLKAPTAAPSQPALTKVALNKEKDGTDEWSSF